MAVTWHALIEWTEATVHTVHVEVTVTVVTTDSSVARGTMQKKTWLGTALSHSLLLQNACTVQFMAVHNRHELQFACECEIECDTDSS